MANPNKEPLSESIVVQPAHAETEEVDNEHHAEAIQREGEGKKVDAIRAELNVDPPDLGDLQKVPSEKLYNDFLAGKLQAVIEAWGFGPKIEHCKAMLAKGRDKKRSKYERRAVKYLTDQFKAIPFKKWAFFPEAMQKERAVNCSGAALIFGHIMNNELHIKTEQVHPWEHVTNLVTYDDGSTQYVDPRNQEIFDLDLGERIEETDGFRVYKAKKRGLEFSLLPVAKAEHGAILVYLENSREMQNDCDHDDEAKKALNTYADVLNPGFARKYMENNFLIRRETDPVWCAEKERVRRMRKLQKMPLVGRLF